MSPSESESAATPGDTGAGAATFFPPRGPVRTTGHAGALTRLKHDQHVATYFSAPPITSSSVSSPSRVVKAASF